MDELIRLIGLVERELGADDARAELGGREPTGENVVWAPMGEGWRVVAVFDVPPTDRGAKEEKLRALLEPFTGLAERARALVHPAMEKKRRELDEELDRLSERAGARTALVVDEGSPIVWGGSYLRAHGWDLDAMEIARALAGTAADAGIDAAAWLATGAPGKEVLEAAGLDETVAQRWDHRFERLHRLVPEWSREDWSDALQIATAVGEARRHCRGGRAPDRVAEHAADWGVFARGFARIYLLVLVFDGAYSELHAEGPVVRALPHLESLVLALPPVEPTPRGAKVIAFRRR